MRTRWLGWEMTSPSRCSIRSASRSGVRPTPKRSASVACDVTAPSAISPDRIAARSRAWTATKL